MRAMVFKEFIELRRDRRTLAMLVLVPLLQLFVFGYAASFDQGSVKVILAGPAAAQAQAMVPPTFEVVRVEPSWTRDDAVAALRAAEADAVLVAGPAPQLLVDGSQLFVAQSIRAATRGLGATPGSGLPAGLQVEFLFNPDLATSAFMVPAIMGMIILFVGTVATSLGVVRERQAGTMEQLAVMPLRPVDVYLGKIVPYFVVGCVDVALVVGSGMLVFGVPFNGNPFTFTLGALLFLFVTLGIGVLISTVSQTQGEAIQLAMLVLLPQVLLSGMIFPLAAMPPGVRWVAYLLPLTYFVEIARGVMVRGAPIESLWFPLLMLGVLGAVTFGLATWRFRRELAPARSPAGLADEETAVAA